MKSLPDAELKTLATTPGPKQYLAFDEMSRRIPDNPRWIQPEEPWVWSAVDCTRGPNASEMKWAFLKWSLRAHPRGSLCPGRRTTAARSARGAPRREPGRGTRHRTLARLPRCDQVLRGRRQRRFRERRAAGEPVRPVTVSRTRLPAAVAAPGCDGGPMPSRSCGPCRLNTRRGATDCLSRWPSPGPPSSSRLVSRDRDQTFCRVSRGGRRTTGAKNRGTRTGGGGSGGRWRARPAIRPCWRLAGNGQRSCGRISARVFPLSRAA